MSTRTIITPEVQAVLKAGSITSGVFRLPDVQLDRKLYQAVAKVLKALGGKWNRKVKGFPVSGAFETALNKALDSGVAIDKDRKMGFFATPPGLADVAVDLLNLELGHTLCEPSAGGGALLDAVVRRLGQLPRTVAIELDPGRSSILAKKFPTAKVHTLDFLKYDAVSPDRILMNSPFGKRVELDHLNHAFDLLAPGGRLVAILPSGVRHNQGKAYDALRTRLESCAGTFIDNPSGSFKTSGTMVNTCLLAVDRPRTW